MFSLNKGFSELLFVKILIYADFLSKKLFWTLFKKIESILKSAPEVKNSSINPPECLTECSKNVDVHLT